jgi:hypothetical protein
MMTPVEGRKQRKALMRDIAREERKTKREELAMLKLAIKEARAQRRLSLREARLACRQGRSEVRRRIRAMRARALDELRVAMAAEKAEAKSRCQAGLSHAKELSAKHESARHALKTERAYRADMRRIERGNRERRRQIIAPRAREIRSEDDDAVRGNIPPELVALFESVRSRIKGSERMTRTEAFLHYAEEHPDEVLRSIEDRSDTMLRELEAQERAARRIPGGGGGRRRRVVHVASLAEAPF